MLKFCYCPSSWISRLSSYVGIIAKCIKIDFKDSNLEWYVKDSASQKKRHPRTFGSRFFICIRPTNITKVFLQYFYVIDKWMKPSKFHMLELEAVLMWVPPTSMMCSLPGASGMWRAWREKENVRLLLLADCNWNNFICFWKLTSKIKKNLTCKRGNSLGWPNKRRNPPLSVKTVPADTLEGNYSQCFRDGLGYQNGWIFGKVLKGGQVIFNPKNYIKDFGPLHRA